MTTIDVTELDEVAAGAFGERLLSVLNDAALSLMISIGDRTGLFEALADGAAVTSEELAERSGLTERYVREWLGAMTTGRVVITDGNGRFRLPREHALSLAASSGGENMAFFMQYIALLGSVEDDIVECFRNGGGVPYSRFGRFHEVMAMESQQSVVAALDEHILDLVPGLKERLSAGIKVLDAGCGRGRALLQLAERYPNSQFVGFDLSAAALTNAEAEAAARGLTNISFVVRDLSDFDETAAPEAFDLVTTFDAVHDQGQPQRLLKGIRRTLRPDGVYLMQDIRASSHVHENIDHPLGTVLYTVSCMHCMTVSLAQDGEGLGAMWGEQTTREYLAAAGFSAVETHALDHDIQNNFYVVRP
jgi:SAM-dependent methyltransferase